jgi:hypothetical protein
MTVSACVMSPMTWRAAPKSSSSGLRVPASSITLSGAMSRWYQRSACSTPSASVSGSSSVISADSSGASGLDFQSSRSVMPSQNGITM